MKTVALPTEYDLRLALGGKLRVRALDAPDTYRVTDRDYGWVADLRFYLEGGFYARVGMLGGDADFVAQVLELATRAL